MTLYYEESGKIDAPALIFIHGGGVSGWIWKKQVEFFQDYHCIVPDLPEHGGSIDKGLLSIEDCAERVSELIEERAKDGKAYVVGHSLGAKVLIQLLAVKPGILCRSVIASALCRPVPFMDFLHNPLLYKITEGVMRPEVMKKLVIKRFRFSEMSFEENCMKEFKKMTADTLYREYDQLYSHLRIPSGVSLANTQVLVTAGEWEPKAVKKSVYDLVASLPKARGVILKNAEHTYPWAMHETFNRLLRSWLDEGKVPEGFGTQSIVMRKL